MTLDRLRTLSDGRYEAVCGGCLASSAPIRAVDAFLAWAELLALGWRTSEPVGRYPLCPVCAVADRSIEAAVKRAHKSRKRK